MSGVCLSRCWLLSQPTILLLLDVSKKIAKTFGRMIRQKMVQKVEVQAYQIQTTEYEKVKGAQNHSQNENSSNVIV